MPVTILTIDDSKMVRTMIGRAFKGHDCRIVEASNGEEGLAAARRERPDLILLDYTMPVMDGLDTMTALQADESLRSIPVIMLTAEGSKDIRIKLAQLGVRDYLVKPFRDEMLLERIGRVVPLAPVAAAQAA